MPDYRASWYSQLPAFGWFDPQDRPNSNALGVPDWQQGIALPSRRTLGQWFNVTAPTGETRRAQQTDVGPAPWTGRQVDISANLANQFGYTPKNFPNASFRVEPVEGGAPLPAASTLAPAQGNKPMPGLMDLFNPGAYQATDLIGQPTDFNSAVAQRSGGLLGLGLGLMGGGWLGGMRGFEAGAANDARARQLALEQRRQLFQEQQAGITPFQRMQMDLAKYKGTPQEEEAKQFYAGQLGTQAQIATITDPNDPDQKISVLWHPRTQQITDLFGRPLSGVAGGGGPAISFGPTPPPSAGGGDFGGPLPGVGGLPTPPATATAPAGRNALPPSGVPAAPGVPNWLGPSLGGGVSAPAGTSYADLPVRTGAKAFEPEEKLRKEFQEVTKTHRDYRDAYNRVLSAEPTGPGDIAMLYAYIKMINPNARINPGQAADAENTAGVPDVIRNLWNRALTGDRLSPAHRAEIARQATGLYAASQNSFDQLAAQYAATARQYRIDPRRVVTPLAPLAPREGVRGGGGGFSQDEIDAELTRRGVR